MSESIPKRHNTRSSAGRGPGSGAESIPADAAVGRAAPPKRSTRDNSNSSTPSHPPPDIPDPASAAGPIPTQISAPHDQQQTSPNSRTSSSAGDSSSGQGPSPALPVNSSDAGEDQPAPGDVGNESSNNSQAVSLWDIVSGRVAGLDSQTLKDGLHDIQEKLGPLKNVDVISEACSILSNAYDVVDKLDKYKKANPDRDVMAFSFSNVPASAYDRLGIEKSTEAKPIESVLAQVNTTLERRVFSNLNSRATYEARLAVFWEKYQSDIETTFNDLLTVAGSKPEATGRLFIDQFMIRIIRFLSENGMPAPFLFPELHIANTKRPVVIHHGNFTTYLTGTVDYALFTYSSAKKIDKKDREEATNQSDLVSVIGTRINKLAMKALIMANKMPVLLVEAKRKDHNDNLEKFIPQVAAESLASMKSIGSQSQGWCLTTGTKWIFGTMKVDTESDSEVERVELGYTEPLYLTNDNGLDSQSVKNILTTMTFWATTEAQKLVRDLGLFTKVVV